MSKALAEWQRSFGTSQWFRVHLPSIIRVHLLPTLGAIKVGKLDRDRVYEFMKDRHERGNSKAGGGPISLAMLRKIRDALKQFVSYGIGRGWLTDNPMPGAKVYLREAENKPQDHGRPHRLLEQDEIARLLTAVRGEEIEVAVWLQLLADMRPSEVVALRWSLIDPTNRELKIKTVEESGLRSLKDHAKTAAGNRAIVYGDVLAEALARQADLRSRQRIYTGSQWRDEGWVLTRVNGQRFNYGLLKDRFNAIARGAGVVCTMYDMRHTYATAAAMAEMPEDEARALAAMMGHTTSDFTRRVYREWSHGAAERVSKVIEAYVLSALELTDWWATRGQAAESAPFPDQIQSTA